MVGSRVQTSDIEAISDDVAGTVAGRSLLTDLDAGFLLAMALIGMRAVVLKTIQKLQVSDFQYALKIDGGRTHVSDYGGADLRL